MNSLKKLIFAVLSIAVANSAFAASYGVFFRIKNDAGQKIVVQRPVFKNLGWDSMYPNQPKLDYDKPHDGWVWGDGPDAIKESFTAYNSDIKIANNQEYYYAPRMFYRTQATFNYVRGDNSAGLCVAEFEFKMDYRFSSVTGRWYDTFDLTPSSGVFSLKGSCKISKDDFTFTPIFEKFREDTDKTNTGLSRVNGVIIHLE